MAEPPSRQPGTLQPRTGRIPPPSGGFPPGLRVWMGKIPGNPVICSLALPVRYPVRLAPAGSGQRTGMIRNAVGNKSRDDPIGTDPPGLDDLRPDLPGAGLRQDPRPADRPGRDRPGRGGRHARLRRALDARRGEGRRLRDDRPALRHDGGRGPPPHGRVLRPGDRTDRRPVLRSPGPARRDDRPLGRALGVPRQ